MKKKEIYSPLSKNKNVKFLYSLETEDIISKYVQGFNIDVKRYFELVKKIDIYECCESGYRFYYPLNLYGDGAFYSELEKFEWYYNPWKWEHAEALKFIDGEQKLLEIGCAQGSFLQKASEEKKIECVGLEFNPSAVEVAKANGMDVREESIEQHCADNEEKYDVICAFEVLEHIAEVSGFIESSLKCLKLKGKLIIAVPNNDSFIRLAKHENLLNMPPHHMGLWDYRSLKSLEKYFSVKLIKVKYEPLQEYHKIWYNDIIKNKYEKIRVKLFLFDILPYRLQRILKDIILEILDILNRKVGHTILVVFEKI
jgi:2-polyprenyl-3-methyl-5-hydroxy-6-metoxy-1,4-benzoquinol methylase